MPQSPYFKPLAPITFGANSATDAGLGTTAAPKLNTSAASGLSINGSGNALLNGQTPTPPPTPFVLPSQFAGNTSTANALTSALPKPTPSGGVSFDPSLSGGFSQSASTQPAQPPANGLAQYLTNSQPVSNGGTISSQGGNINGYTAPAGFTINTGNIPSSALSSGVTTGDLSKSYGSYQDYINAVSEAQGYSPQYLQALQGQYGAQTQGAQLQAQSADINANTATGIGTTGLSGGQAQTLTGQEQALNAQQQQTNAIQQLGANQALNTQQLARTGAISAAQTQLQYSPTAIASQNAINQYNTLQQQYPNAAIPEYNNALSPALNQQIAQELVANSPAYKAGFQSTYQTPGGGTGIYSKLDVGSGGFTQNQDGSYTLVPAAAAALGSANANVVQTQLGKLSNINSAINASTKTLSTTQQFMNQYGLNQSGVSILSQIQNSANKQLDKAGAVAGLNADLNALRSDYAQYLIGRGGSVAGTNDEANKAIPDTISPAQLQTLVQQMQQGGQNTADAVSSQVNQALGGITNNTVPNSGVSSANPFSAQNFFGQ